MDIDDATFVVTDTETTGTHRGARVIEIGAVKVKGGRVVDRFQQLINPGQSIPRRITQITGITTGMVFDKPPADEVMPEYMEFLGDDIFVAHNLSFDRRMVNGELARLGRAELDHRMLCTLRLARRLLYELSSKSLGSLCSHYQISMVNRHRALGDAEATAEVLGRLSAHFEFAHETSSLDDLLNFQYARYRNARSVPPNVRRLRREVLGDLPREPGVYFMEDEKGYPLYIGKAKNIRDRVQTYFTGLGAHGQRMKKLVESVRDLTWRTTDTELDALLDESRLIKERKPRYNRMGRSYRSRPFLRLAAGPSGVDLSVTTCLRDDDAEYYGPVTPRRRALQFVELLSKLFSVDGGEIECAATPSVGHTADVPVLGTDGPASSAHHLRAFLSGEDETILNRLEEAMYAASDQRRYERARWFRDQRKHLLRLQRSLAWMGGPLRSYRAVLMLPAAAQNRVRLFIVDDGRLVRRATVDRPVAARPLAEELQKASEADRAPLEGHADELIEELRILLHWLRSSGDDMRQIRWRGDELPTDLARRIVKRVREERAA